MSRVRKKVPAELKARILAESSKAGCVIVDLAESYGIPRRILYSWRSKAKKKLAMVDSRDKFVELVVTQPAQETFKKAELVFGDCVLLMEGRFSSAKFISILKILEAAC
jgi:transposase-like protein